MDRRFRMALLGLSLLLAPIPSEAFFGGDFQNIDPNQPLDPALVEALILTFGGAADHRPGLGGGPLNETGVGFDGAIQMSLVKPPHSYFRQMGGEPSQLLLPIPRIMVHKGFGSRVTAGLSAIGYLGQLILGADLTWAIVHKEEGPTIALRWAVSHARLTVPSGGSESATFRVNTYTPQIVVSRKLNFADPYLGIGYSLMSGRVTIPVDVGSSTVRLSQDGKAGNFISFLGVAFRLGPSGLRLGFEGSYSPAGMHTLGTRIGFQF